MRTKAETPEQVKPGSRVAWRNGCSPSKETPAVFRLELEEEHPGWTSASRLMNWAIWRSEGSRLAGDTSSPKG